ncbi:MAG: MBL fold metallo-hydrolase [Halobacteria archaeon]|nr:MBL fold metallo-hydrolase [Halobacteria archaeon]
MEEIAQNLYFVEADKPGSHTYVFEGESRTAVVDPGLSSNYERVVSEVGEPDILVNTHEHFDHIGANPRFQDDCLVAAHRYSAVKMVTGDDDVMKCRANGQPEEYEVDLWLENNALFDLGGKRLKILHTPGHTSGSLCVYDTETRALVTGDTVYAYGTISDIYKSGSYGEYANSLRRLNNFRIDVICPGHGDISYDPEETLEKSITKAEERIA